jgi:hypothetical protein
MNIKPETPQPPPRVRLDLTLSLALLFAICVETASGLTWAGRTAARLDSVERMAVSAEETPERLARLEERLTDVQASLLRIERRIDAKAGAR